MNRSLEKIQELRGIDKLRFERDIVPLGKPAVLKGAIAHWPAVREGLTSPASLVAYIKRFDNGKPAQTLVGDASIKGRFFYKSDDLQQFNFKRRQDPISTVMDWLVQHEADAEPPAVAIQSVPLPEYLPGFMAENQLDWPPPSAVPRIWIGNRVTTSTHFDFQYNIACVVAGHRRFTLFPPEELPNLYVGPLDHTPAGPPASMVSLEDPDFERYPRFSQALDAAQQAEMEPGDALYIPYFWWHHVTSLDGFNILVNYWWNEARTALSTPMNCLLYAFLTLRDLPDDQREIWRMVFDHYIFMKNGDPSAHIDPSYHGIVRALSPDMVERLRTVLLQSLGR